MVHRKGRILFANQAAADILGYATPRALIDLKDIQTYVAPDDRARTKGYADARLRGEEAPTDYEFRAIRKDGSLAWVRNQVRVVEWEGEPAIQVHWTDITEFKQAERERDRAEARLVDAIESVSEGFALWDSDDRLVLSNANYLEMFSELSDILVAGVHFEDFLKAAVERGVYDTEGEPVESFVARRLTEHRNPTEVFERLVGGERWVRISKRRTESGGVVGIWTDITERKRTENEIRELAMSDALTGLANRNRFHSDLGRALANAKRHDYRVALLFLDIDKFKSVNDEFGHPVGDDLLKQVASRLVAATREADTVARLGGDEFAIIMTHVERADAPAPLASRIIESLSAPFHLSGQIVEIGSSVGISVYPDDDTVVDELIRKADAALYQAKARGVGNYRLYDAALHDATRAVKRIERELRLAIDRDEFTLYYQPQFDISTKRVTGAEALVRWQHPERGLLSPGEFITVAESSILIVQIGQRVLQMACAQAKQWQAEAQMPALRVAVNISPRQFKSDELVGLVEDTLRETGVAGESLEVEITEGMMMEDVEQARETLSRLKELGVSIAIDDFGTGYSSLAYLKRFPVQRLKIDQSFVRGLTTDADDAAIVKAVIQLGHNLRLTVIAEGVEADEQLAVLRDLGCDEAQGYLFCRPVPPDEFTAWVEARHQLRPLEPTTAPA
jgi:diguanylate cyclase (GGDEF)-like protein/PAS domain S-box-containing protein